MELCLLQASRCSHAVCSCRLLSLCNCPLFFLTCLSRNWKPILICVCVCVYIYISFLKFRCSVCLAVIILIFLFAAIICSLSYIFPQGNFLELHQLIKSVTYLFILWVGFLLQKQQLLLKWNIFVFLNHLLFSYFLKLIFF